MLVKNVSYFLLFIEVKKDKELSHEEKNKNHDFFYDFFPGGIYDLRG